MKKNIIILCALLISVSAFSQQQQRRGFFNRVPEPVPVVFTPVNELKFNLGTAIFASYPEIAFERIFEESLGFGFSAGFRIGENNQHERFNFHVMSHFRWYLFSGDYHPGAGFFVEVNGGVFNRDLWKTGDWDGDRWVPNRRYESKTGAGFGMGAGWKFVMDNNWLFETSFIVGRDFVNESIYPYFGVSVGRRF